MSLQCLLGSDSLILLGPFLLCKEISLEKTPMRDHKLILLRIVHYGS